VIFFAAFFIIATLMVIITACQSALRVDARQFSVVKSLFFGAFVQVVAGFIAIKFFQITVLAALLVLCSGYMAIAALSVGAYRRMRNESI
jgi:hypothetical protein